MYDGLTSYAPLEQNIKSGLVYVKQKKPSGGLYSILSYERIVFPLKML